jgi:protein SCO1/2
MKTQLLRIYERYLNNEEVRIVSHSIDPTFDTPSVLHSYAERLQVKAPKWTMLTGDKGKIYQLGEKSYMVTAQEDKNEAGGFVHSGAFILVDKQRHVRGIYDGTKEEEVNHLIEDLEILLNEKP